jgi:thiopeptide-type bacteriocin biosynthesis protein
MRDAILQPFSFILLRTPLQSLKSAYKFSIDVSPIFQEGLYLSSPEFWQEFQKAGISSNNEKISRSFSKYWLRSCTRCTPYATFAGSLLVATTDNETNIIISDSSQHIRKIRIDMNYMAELIHAITKIPDILYQIRFYANNSIYSHADSFRYVEYTIHNNTRNYHLTSIRKTNYVAAVLEHAKCGATIKELVAIIIGMEEVEEEEANAFIISMWQSQLLISELDPDVTGKEPLDKFIEQLLSLNEVGELVKQLNKIQYLIQHPQEGIDYYQAIEKELKALDLPLEIPKNTLQTDLFLSARIKNINKPLVQEIVTQASDLMALARQNKNPELESFKTKFYAKYEDAEIPVNIALDVDLGIGYAGLDADSVGKGELIDGLAISIPGKPGSGDFDYILQYTLYKYYDFLKNQKPFIEITEEELAGYKNQIEGFKFPNSMYLMGELLKKNEKLDDRNFTFDLSAFGGPSAGNLLGRFTGGDSQIYEATKEVLRQEELEHPDAIYAEIAHLPQVRTGNILLRPILRDYEIPYVGKSGIPEEKQIVIDDLMVSVKNNEVVLRSKNLDKRIIPRLTTSHNFRVRSLPIYKFLCDLQRQGLAYPNVWDWGHLDILKHLPRVVYKNVIVKKARWKIEEKDIKDLPSSISEIIAYLEAFRKKWDIPLRVVYKEYDNELLIDFNEEMGINLFLHYLKKYKNILIEEFLFSGENCFVSDVNAAPYTNEIIIPVHQAQVGIKQQRLSSFNSQNNSSSIKRRFSIYSEWLYFKVYCGPKTAETLLKNTILPFIEFGMREQMFEQFFFIRYKDESSHIRIRFYNSQIRNQLLLQKEFMQALQPFIDNESVEKVVTDTYSREVERYGEGLVERAEKLFHNDSLAVLRFISLLEDEAESEKYRLLFALRGIDMLLSDFNLDIREKAELSKEIQTSFFKEFGGQLILQRQLNGKYRKYQQAIFSHMNGTQDAKNEIEEAVAIFKTRSEMNAPIIADINSKLSPYTKQALFKLLPNYIHMFMNRLFIAQQRKYELVVYHFLARYYTSQVAINTKKEEVLAYVSH